MGAGLVTKGITGSLGCTEMANRGYCGSGKGSCLAPVAQQRASRTGA